MTRLEMTDSLYRARLRVAVLDDDPDTADSIVASMKARHFDASGYQDPDELLRALGSCRFDAFVVDWQLSHGTSAPLIQELRRRRETSQAPIYVLSGNLTIDGIPADVDLARAVQAYGVRYRCKPFSIRRLCQELDSDIDQRRAA